MGECKRAGSREDRVQEGRRRDQGMGECKRGTSNLMVVGKMVEWKQRIGEYKSAEARDGRVQECGSKGWDSARGRSKG